MNKEPDPDPEICERIRGGNASAVSGLLDRDYPIADLLGRAAAAADPGESVELAWELLITDLVHGTVTRDVRAALLERVIAVLDERGLLDTGSSVTPSPAMFLPSQDRWAGWWADDDPHAWPPGTTLTLAQVMQALRWMRVELRVLLILRDAGEVAATAAEPIVHVAADRQDGWLDEAREAYVHAMERVVNGRPSGEGSPDGQRPGTGAVTAVRARDVDCETIVKIMGRWLDGEMSESDRDGYEQHLLFCPTCLAHNDKTRLALAALRAAPVVAASDDIRRHLARLVPSGGDPR